MSALTSKALGKATLSSSFFRRTLKIKKSTISVFPSSISPSVASSSVGSIKSHISKKQMRISNVVRIENDCIIKYGPSWGEGGDVNASINAKVNSMRDYRGSGGLRTYSTSSSSTSAESESEETVNYESSIPSSMLHYASKSYGRYALPPYHHPSEFKVVLTFKLPEVAEHLQLSEDEVAAVEGILGPRCKNGKVKMAEERFSTRVENRAKLREILHMVIYEAKKFVKTHGSSAEGS